MSKLNLPEIGKAAPDFSTLDQDGNNVSLKDLRGKTVVLYFYPKAMTPGCTVQAQGIRDHKSEFEKLNAVVLGISPDETKRLVKFTERDELNFTLLSDPEHKIADDYGVWALKKFMGKEYEGIHRLTFIIDPEGNLVHIMEKVKTKSHHDDVLEILRSL
ncbi:thioredoxin-dependent thiol peroxidase [Bacterioplanoides sp. SCSIO 12839]|uniref:thioredoxin-dependent thiol peroxidase n=1 Tax=Bacterioplanoides sp. SCSIO 12839 TaxID=2829569 RepID=UPI002104E46B|nr:thioredoxin-dependent thiol peroxidase [Bacterioplanoides sp. SCSIO 12839]UTW48967.1 thioredoxin-dependent thiol peroxidase [Bacterioplanoides sp. SCSIO 12839]